MKKRGRPKTLKKSERLVTKTFACTAADWKKLGAEARKLHLTRSELVRRAVAEYLGISLGKQVIGYLRDRA